MHSRRNSIYKGMEVLGIWGQEELTVGESGHVGERGRVREGPEEEP